MVNYKNAIEIAQTHLKNQKLDLVVTEADAASLYERALAHVPQVLPADILAAVPLDDRALAAMIFGYYQAKANPTSNSYLVPYGPTTINVDMDNIGHVFYHFSTFDAFLDHCPQVKYWEPFLVPSAKLKDDKGNVILDAEGKEVDGPPIILTAQQEYQAGIYFYTGFFFFGEDKFAECMKTRDSYDPADILTQSGVNEELKAKILELDQTLLTKHLAKVDSYIDKKPEQYLLGTTKSMNIGVYDLYKGKINDVDVAFVRCFCPSTDRMFLLEVEDRHTNAKDAIASLAQVPKCLKDKVLYIQRNGEVFHFATSDETTADINSGKYSQEQLADLVSFTGDEYFSLMKAEL